jgi:hypothetical protein
MGMRGSAEALTLREPLEAARVAAEKAEAEAATAWHATLDGACTGWTPAASPDPCLDLACDARRQVATSSERPGTAALILLEQAEAKVGEAREACGDRYAPEERRIRAEIEELITRAGGGASTP